MGLQYKHVAPYLPYDLKFMRYEHKAINNVVPIVWSEDRFPVVTSLNPVTLNGFKFFENKLILIPLAELATNEWMMDHLYGECKNDENLDYLCEVDSDLTTTPLSYKCVSILISNHYDVFGLIKLNQAIDIRTL